MPVTDQAEREYTRVFGSLTQRWGDTMVFRRLAELGKPAAAVTLASENRRFALGLLTGGELSDVVKDEGLVELLGGPDAIGDVLTDRQMTAFQAAVDAASIVFMHAAVDAAVSDLCRVSRMIEPGDWERYVEQRQLGLQEARETTYAELLEAKTEEYVEQLERESVLKRADHLFAICQPPDDFEARKGFRYDRDRFETIDQLRHDLVHSSPGGLQPIPTAVEDIEFLVSAGIHLWALLNHKYEVKMNPVYSLEVFGGGGPGDRNGV